MIYNQTNKTILEELNKSVYGHHEAKKALINLVNRSKIRHYQKRLLKPSKLLLIGASGTGKTHLVRSLARIVHFPLLIVDGSSFNPTGASGGIKPQTLQRMIIEKAEEYSKIREGTYFSLDDILDQMVVFVDEFDKISSHYDGTSGNWNEHTQTQFLSLFENYDTLAGVSWVFAGAFSGLTPTAKASGVNIGFTSPLKTDVDTPEVTDEDIVRYGLLPEIVGRLTSICRLDVLTEVDFYKILTDQVLPQKQKELSYLKINKKDFMIDDDKLKAIAKSAEKSSQGVRYLSREIDRYFLELEFSYEDKLDKTSQ